MSGLLGDPDEEDKYGVTRGQRQQMAFANIGNIGALLMAAGQPITDAQRAQILAQLGGVAGQMPEQMMQARAIAARERLAQRQIDDRNAYQNQTLDLQRRSLDQRGEYQNQMLEMQQRALEARRELERAQAEARNNRVPPGYRMSADGTGLEAIPGGPADLEVLKHITEAKRKADEKAIPQTITKGIQENLNSLRKIDQAAAELDRRPESVGGVGSVLASSIPGIGNLQNRELFGVGDPEGAKLRALIADIGSLKIHDRSGAAVTATEFPRLKPFVPNISDDPATVRTKLQNFRAEYESAIRDAMDYYSAANGFRPYTPASEYLDRQAPQVPPAQSAPEPMRAFPPGAVELLKKNPQLRDAFDQKYGPGSAARVLGQ